MSTSRHTHQIAHDVLGQYVSVGLEDPEAPHQFPLQPPNLPTAPTPIEANTFIHIPDSPTLSPSPFQYLLQEVSNRTLEEHLTEEQSHSTPGSAPVSRTSPTNSGEILQQLVQVLSLLGWAPPMSTHLTHLLHPPPASDHQTHSMDLTQTTSNHSCSNV